MARMLKIFGIAVATLLGLVLLAVVVVNLMPDAQYKKLVTSIVATATDRQLVIEGDVDVRLTTVFAFRAEQVAFRHTCSSDWRCRA